MTQLSNADQNFAEELMKFTPGSGNREYLIKNYPHMVVTLVNKARALRDAERDPEIAVLKDENAMLRELVKKSLTAITSSYEEVHAEWRGYDKIADKHNKIVRNYRAEASIVLGCEASEAIGYENS